MDSARHSSCCNLFITPIFCFILHYKYTHLSSIEYTPRGKRQEARGRVNIKKKNEDLVCYFAGLLSSSKFISFRTSHGTASFTWAIYLYFLFFLEFLLIINLKDLGCCLCVNVAAFCDGKCKERCNKAAVWDRCFKYCGLCCEECKCVPSGTYGNKHQCPCYRDKLNNKGKPKCPWTLLQTFVLQLTVRTYGLNLDSKISVCVCVICICSYNNKHIVVVVVA